MIVQTVLLLAAIGFISYFVITLMQAGVEDPEDTRSHTYFTIHEPDWDMMTHPDFSDADEVFTDAREEWEDQDQTPKAEPVKPETAVPTFSLDEANAGKDTSNSAPSPPALPKLRGGPNKILAVQRSAGLTGLMPPPSAKPSARPSPQVPVLGGGLSVPSTGPLPARGPPPTAGVAPTANTAGKRNKVLLKPGHSPLDWATLTRKGSLSGVSTMQRVTPSMLKHNNGRKGKPAWSSYKGKVYHISPYLPFHPGGEGELMRAAGRDGEKAFMEIHPWVNWDNMLSSCLVGIMVPEGADEGLEALD